PYFVLGLGANVLIGDRGFRGLVIRNIARGHEFREQGDACHLWTESGAVVKDLIQESVARGWSGLEHYAGIPSTVGGAVWQNLHFLSPAPERERTMFIAELFETGDILSEEGDRKTVDKQYVNFGYDDSVFHHWRDVVLAATFRLARGDQPAPAGSSTSAGSKGTDSATLRSRICTRTSWSTSGAPRPRTFAASSRSPREWSRNGAAYTSSPRSDSSANSDARQRARKFVRKSPRGRRRIARVPADRPDAPRQCVPDLKRASAPRRP